MHGQPIITMILNSQVAFLDQFENPEASQEEFCSMVLTHCGRVTQICVFNTVKLGTSARSP